MDNIYLIQIFSDSFGDVFVCFFLGQGHLLLEQVAELPIHSGHESFQRIILSTSFFQRTFYFPAKRVTLLLPHLFKTSLTETRDF